MEKKKLKILYMITGLKLGGAEIQLLNMVKNINRDLFDCSILYIKGEPDIEGDFNNLNIKVYNNSIYSLFNPIKYVEIFRIIKNNDFDILHTHLIHCNLIGRVIGRLAGVKSIINSEHNTSNWQKNNFFLIILYKITLKYVDIIHCISNSVKTKITDKIDIDNKKLRIVYNGINMNHFITKQEGIKKELFSIEPYPVLGCVSRLDKRKGLEYLIRAIKILKNTYKNIKLLLVGEGSEKKSLTKLVNDLKLEEQILFVGKTNETKKYLQALDVFVLPSLQEGLSIAIIEAMAAGVPVIASNVNGIPEVVTNNLDGILIDPQDEYKIAKAVEKLINNKTFRDSLVENAYEKVKVKFDIKNIVNEFQDLYLELEYGLKN